MGDVDTEENNTEKRIKLKGKKSKLKTLEPKNNFEHAKEISSETDIDIDNDRVNDNVDSTKEGNIIEEKPKTVKKKKKQNIGDNTATKTPKIKRKGGNDVQTKSKKKKSTEVDLDDAPE